MLGEAADAEALPVGSDAGAAGLSPGSTVQAAAAAHATSSTADLRSAVTLSTVPPSSAWSDVHATQPVGPCSTRPVGRALDIAQQVRHA